MNGCDFTSPPRIQTSEQEYNYPPVTGGCRHRTPATLPKAFIEEPGRCFLEVSQTRVDVLGILTRFLVNLLESL